MGALHFLRFFYTLRPQGKEFIVYVRIRDQKTMGAPTSLAPLCIQITRFFRYFTKHQMPISLRNAIKFSTGHPASFVLDVN